MAIKQFFSLKISKELLDYVRAIGSIHSIPINKVIASAIVLCMKNNDTFVDFLKKEVEKDKENNE